jgi:hypothetical protein
VVKPVLVLLESSPKFSQRHLGAPALSCVDIEMPFCVQKVGIGNR